MTKSVNIKTLASTAKQYATADKKYESAAAAREKMVVKFADQIRGFGFLSCASFRPKGEFGTEFKDAVAAEFLTAAEFKAYGADMAAFKTVNGKRVYSAKHNAGVKVANFIKRLLDAAEPHVDPKSDKADDTAKKGASRNKSLSEAIETALDGLIKRIGVDARKAEPTGIGHAELKDIIVKARKECAAILK